MIYGWFTEALTHDLVEARALLDNLATELAGEKMDATNHLFHLMDLPVLLVTLESPPAA
ncbi:MAG: hypothetical protein R2867_26765 [Caldilineaceae bacterium]